MVEEKGKGKLNIRPTSIQSNGSMQTAPAPPKVFIARLFSFGKGCRAVTNVTANVARAKVVLRCILYSDGPVLEVMADSRGNLIQ
jgi:hypothetical protein